MISKQAGKLVALGCTLILFLSFLFNFHADYQNELLRLILNTFFSGFIPIIISAIAGLAFLRTNRNEALLICCGMLLFGLASIVIGLLSFSTDSEITLDVVYSTCTLISSICYIHAALMLNPDNSIMKSSKHRLLFSIFLLSTFFILLIVFTLSQIFLNKVYLFFWFAIILNLYASFVFYKLYQKKQENFFFWFSLALFLFSMRLLAVCIVPGIASLQRWIGRSAQYIGSIFALISIASIFIISKHKKFSMSAFLERSLSYHKSQTLINTIFEGIPCPVFLKDCEGNYVAGNSGLCSIFGTSIDAILGKSDSELFEYDKAKLIVENDRFVIDSGLTHVFEEYLPTRDGECLFLSTKTPWLDESGTVLGLIGFAQDITERKQLESKIQQQAEELEKKNQIITDYFTNVSHEFKTPLNIMMLGIDLLETNGHDTKSIAIIKQNCYGLGKLIVNLLDIAKIDAGQFETNYEYYDIIHQLNGLTESVSQYIENKNLKLQCNFSHKEKYIYSDSFMIERIIMNLLSNAIKYTESGDYITLNCSIASHKVSLSVKDTGKGISPKKAESIFDRFAGESCGIGLALTKSLVELLEGTIWFESNEGDGTEFFVELPIQKSPRRVITKNHPNTKHMRRIQMELSDMCSK